MSRSSRKQGLSVFVDIYNRISTKKNLKIKIIIKIS